jgi:hypothetical protein
VIGLTFFADRGAALWHVLTRRGEAQDAVAAESEAPVETASA